MPRTQPDYHGLLPCISNALQALSDDEPRMVRDAALDALLERISRSLHWRQRLPGNPQIPSVVLRSREYLRAHATGGAARLRLLNRCMALLLMVSVWLPLLG